MTSDQRAAGAAGSKRLEPAQLPHGVPGSPSCRCSEWLLLADSGHVWGYRLAALYVFAVAMVTDSIDGDLAGAASR